MKDPGTALKSERRRLNLSLADVAQKLKISHKQLEALEENDFNFFAGSVFVHGYIRNYSKILGIESQPLITAADELLSPPSVAIKEAADKDNENVQKQEKNTDFVVLCFLISFLVLSVGLGLLLGTTQTQRTGSKQIQSEDLLDDPRQKLSERKQSGDALRKSNETTSAAEIRPNDGVPVTEPTEGMGVIVLTFSQESWVEVKNGNGETIFAELNPQGVDRQIIGKPPLSLIIGNASGVSLSFNNNIVDLAPHTRVSVARLVLE